MNTPKELKRVEFVQSWNVVSLISNKLEEYFPNEEMVSKDSCKAFFEAFSQKIQEHNKLIERMKRRNAVSKNGILQRRFSESGEFIDYEYSAEGLNNLEDELEVFMREEIDISNESEKLNLVHKSDFPERFVKDFQGVFIPLLTGLILKE